MSASTERAQDDLAPVGAGFGVALALLVGGAVRLIPIVGTHFPIHDGGLFATMIEDLVANGLVLPTSTTYNGLQIPFAYPPLAFFVAGALHQAFDITVLDTLRSLPILFSLATIPAVYWLGREILGSRTGGVLTAVSFALLPRAYMWMIPGGGITRALGFFLAILAVGIAWRLLLGTSHRWLPAVALGLVGGLTVLAHPQAGVFMAVSVLAFLPWARGLREATRGLLVAGVIGLLVLVPWLLTVVGRHGLGPLLSAAASGGDTSEGLLSLVSFRFTGMVFLDVIGMAAFIGAAWAIRRRELVLPFWLLVIWLIDSRAGSTFAMVPVSLLAAYALLAISPTWLPAAGTSPIRATLRHPWRSAGVVGFLLVLIFGNYLSGLGSTSPLFALTDDQRAAMAWVLENAEQGDSFAVITGTDPWANDSVSEWFPALTEVTSPATVQGHEWLGPAAWERQQRAYNDLQKCARDVLPCVVSWADEYGRPVTHVYLPKGRLRGPLSESDCCPAPRHSVDLVPGARVIYDGPGATVIELP